MKTARHFDPAWISLLLGLCGIGMDQAWGVEAALLRAINLNGPALRIDGREWAGNDGPHLKVEGKLFENQAVPLKPPTDPGRARMIRSSVWGSRVDVSVGGLPAGECRVWVHVWEDNHSEQFDLLVNDRVVVDRFHSGAAGSWKRLGPWRVTPLDGWVKVSARAASHGAANLSGIEIWSGDGEIPGPSRAPFVTEPSSDQTAFFESRVRPVLVEHCYECHSATANKIKGGLELDTRAGVIRGGDSGAVIVPGQPEASLLIQAIHHRDPDLAMPPRKKLSEQAIADLEAWVRMGAPDPRIGDGTVAARSGIDWNRGREWWSFRELNRPEVPTVRNEEWPAGDLDRFVLARMEKEGLGPVADAGKRTLIRRVTFDLTGLPPTPREVESFLEDASTNAYARVVDRLLASPQYGERWGRHWLDVVRYADTAGDNSDFPIPQMHRYRDWVINAFNRDLPYDQFVREQLAGDLLAAGTPEETRERIIVTGYIANARRFGSRVDDYPQHLTIEDTIDNLGRAFLGLSVGCARCHDHKFDPISASDYYALYGFFENTRYPWPGIELQQRQRDLVPLVEPGRRAEVEAAWKAHEAERERLRKEVQKLKDSLKDKSGDEKKSAESALQTAEKALADFIAAPFPFDWAYAVAESGRSVNVAIQMKGDPAKPGDVVSRRFLTILGGQELSASATGSGRLELAGWIADPRNPLTARVLVNRVWLHHFGRGLVPTPNDFGRQGKPPSHPELLDWLARQFIESGWSVKALHRTILLSRTFRLSGARSGDAIERDPGNEFLSAYPRRRLDAESLRDSMLFLSGDLDVTPAGAHPFPAQSEWKFTQHNPFKAVYESKRRSVYLMTQRIQRHPYLAIFDGADPSASTAVRTASTTPLQALFLLNDPFVHEQARGFSRRMVAAANDESGRIGFAYRSALGRPPEPGELEQCVAFLDQARARIAGSGIPAESVESEVWQAMARAILRLNEFVYID
jgi:hypothetical protein